MKKIVPNLFFLFLTSPILSPYVGGVTIYLSALILIFDVIFIKWLINNTKRDQLIIIVTLFLLMLIASRSPTLIVKMLLLLISTIYAYYCYVNNKFYLYRWVVFNIIIAVAQFTFIFIDFDTAILIGPENITKTIWGSFAGPTNTNFYAVSILPRVCGLSREGGFFASLLGVTFFLLIYDKSIEKKRKRILYLILTIGVTISLSKSSLFVVFVPVIVYFKKYINLLGVTSVALLYLVLLTGICYYVYCNTGFFNDVGNITFTHRFSGYAFAPFAKFRDLFVGTDLLTLLRGVRGLSSDVIWVFNETPSDICGLPYLYLTYGIQVFGVFILFLKFFRFNSSSLLLVVILTTNVTPFTCDGFAVMAWLLAITMMKPIQPIVINNTIVNN